MWTKSELERLQVIVSEAGLSSLTNERMEQQVEYPHPLITRLSPVPGEAGLFDEDYRLEPRFA
jgi:hypothetical protein